MPTPSTQETAAKVAKVLMELEKALNASDVLTGAERHEILAGAVWEIQPEEEEEYRVKLGYFGDGCETLKCGRTPSCPTSRTAR